MNTNHPWQRFFHSLNSISFNHEDWWVDTGTFLITFRSLMPQLIIPTVTKLITSQSHRHWNTSHSVALNTHFKCRSVYYLDKTFGPLTILDLPMNLWVHRGVFKPCLLPLHWGITCVSSRCASFEDKSGSMKALWNIHKYRWIIRPIRCWVSEESRSGGWMMHFGQMKCIS